MDRGAATARHAVEVASLDDARVDAGGRAGAGGFSYQHRVAAWFAVRVLAGIAAPPLTELWSGTLVRIDCETGEPVDDARVTFSGGSVVVVQAKRTITLSGGRTSELAKTVGQFVAQHVTPGHEDDRLVLVTTSAASASVRVHLANVLDHLRSADQSVPIADLRLSQRQRQALKVVTAHASHAFDEVAGRKPSEDELRGFLQQVAVLTLDVESDGVDEREARQLLRSEVLADPALGDAAWGVLVEHCAQLAVGSHGADLSRLQAVLTGRSLPLRGLLDFRTDVEGLRAATELALASVDTSLLTLPTPSGPLALDRPIFARLAALAVSESFLVTGDPGIGKTVALHRLAEHLKAEDVPVLFLPVGDVAATSRGELRTELNLSHDVVEVVSQWRPGRSGVLILDAFDAARTDLQAALWRAVIAGLHSVGWTVVVSVRTWDARHSPVLRALFPARGGGDAGDLGDVQHHHVGPLSDEELAQLRDVWRELGDLIDSAPEELRTVLHNPFNLRLAAELLNTGTPLGELREIRSQIQLLWRYWERRVSDEPGGVERREVVRRVCDHAVAERSMIVPRSAVLRGDTAAGDHLRELLSRSVLAEVPALPGGPSIGDLRFGHHVLFDYGVAVAILAESGDGLLSRLRADADLVLFARPSVDMHLERLWDDDPGRFLELAIAVSDDGDLPRLTGVAFAEVIARRAGQVDQLQPLLDALDRPAQQAAAARLLDDVAIAVSIDCENEPAAREGIWPHVLSLLSERVERAETAIRILLNALVLRDRQPQGDDLNQCARAARPLLEHTWAQPPSGAVRLPIEAVIATIAADPSAAEELLRRVLRPDHLRERGYNDFLGSPTGSRRWQEPSRPSLRSSTSPPSAGRNPRPTRPG